MTPLESAKIPDPLEHRAAMAQHVEQVSDPPAPPGRGWDYEQYIDALTQKRETMEAHAWDIGDDLLALFGDSKPKAGRPPTISPQITLSDVSRDTLMPRRRLGEYLDLSDFYPPDARQFDRDVIAYTHYQLAKKHARTLDEALAKLREAERLHLTTRPFERWLKGYWGEAKVPVEWLDPRARAALNIPAGEEMVWLISSRPQD